MKGWSGKRMGLTAMLVVGGLLMVSQVSEAQRKGGGVSRGGGAIKGGAGAVHTSGGEVSNVSGGARMSSGGGSRVSNGSGGAARTSVNRDFNTAGTTNRSVTSTTTIRNADRQQLRSSTANGNVNQNVSRNGNYDLDYDVDDHWHPVAGAAAFTAGATITAAAIGSVAYSLPPSCTSTTVGGVTYQQCGSTWYQPRFAGTSVTYVVVSPPH